MAASVVSVEPVDFRAMIWEAVRGAPLGRPVTMNHERAQGHWGGRSSATSKWRRASAKVFTEALEAGEIRPLETIRVQAVPTYLRGPLGDVGAPYPTVKAIIDGAVDAGLIPDDNPPHMTALLFSPPVKGNCDGIAIRIRPGVEAKGHRYDECWTVCRDRWQAEKDGAARRKAENKQKKISMKPDTR